MRGKHPVRLGDLQLLILGVLWEEGEATVGRVHRALREERELAYTTIATMLHKMEERRLVHSRKEGRRLVYRPVVASDAVRSGMVKDLLGRLFEGSVEKMVHHLLDAGDVSPGELERIEALLAERRKERTKR
jgi:predicted transcriptional regulator